MATHATPANTRRLALLNAPDATIGEKDAAKKAGQAFRIQLIQDLTKEMREHMRHGKAQLVLGTNPHLRFGSNTFVPIATQAESFRREIYAQDGQDLVYKGLVSHTFAETKAKEVLADTDAAVAKLQATMANLQKEKEENKAQSVNAIMTNNKKAVLVRQPGALRAKDSRASQPALSTLGPVQTSTSSANSLRAQLGPAVMNSACRQVLVHLLAVQPLKIEEIIKTTNIPKDDCIGVLQKIANPQADLKWKLTDKAYKELDPYTFKYKDEDRTAAIDNAVIAFDRQRVSKDDKLWQKLLPVSERGTGKTLSKLNLTGPGSLTPLPRPSTKSSSPGNDSVSGAAMSADERGTAKFGAAAEVRAKQIFNRKATSKPSSSSKPSKATNSDLPTTAMTVNSDNDMAKKGVATKVLKRKAPETKFKSDERINDSDIDDDNKIANGPSEPRRKKLKTNSARADGTQTELQVKVSSSTPSVNRERAADGRDTVKPQQASAGAAKPKVATDTTSPNVKKTLASTSSANPFFGGALSTAKIRKVSRNTGSASETEKPKPTTSSASAASRQPERQAAHDPQEKKSGDANNVKLKQKTNPAPSTPTVKGLTPSPNLPPKPPKIVSTSNNRNSSSVSQSANRPGQAAYPRTNGGSASSANANLKQTQKQTVEASSHLHNRHPSTSTVSSSSAASAIFTPPTHRNSTSSSLSSSSMVSTRSETRNAAKRSNDNDKDLKAQPVASSTAPPTKKIKTSEANLDDSPNSSPLTATSELADVSTPAQLEATRSPPKPNDKRPSPQSRTQPDPLSTSNVDPSQPTTTNDISFKRLRLTSLRSQFTSLFSTWITARVHYHQSESLGTATAASLDNLKAHHTRVKAMEVEIRKLMEEIHDFTWWDGVPAGFVTEHEDVLRERLRMLHGVYNEKWDELEKMEKERGKGKDKKEEGEVEMGGDESYEELKKEVWKRLEEIEDLQAILHPMKEWGFVEGSEGAAALPAGPGST